MLAAIGLILILKQLPHLVGYDADFVGDESFEQQNNENTFSAIAHAFRAFTPVAALIGISGLLFQILWEKLVAGKKGFIRLVPAPLIVVLAAVGINLAFGANGLKQEHLVSIPVASSAGAFFSFFTFPDWNQLTNSAVWV